MITKKSVDLFKKMVTGIPGYSEFLVDNEFNPNNIKSIEDFYSLPITTKKNYLQNYSSKKLIWEADWNGPLSYSSTSGSTGEPYYFPRKDELAWQNSFTIENFLKSSSYGNGRTLVLVGFGMGVWIGGVLTVRQFEIASERMNVPVSILPTGYNKKEMFKALKKLSPDFVQTIIVGYPPFVKELVDESESEGIDLSALNIRILFAAEAFTEDFRNYVCNKAGIKNPIRDTLNIYGTADIGAMASETPLSILIRRIAVKNPLLYKDIFGQLEKTPTLAQYNPNFIEFETVGGEIVLTSDAALPLIRYAVGDNGGTIGYDLLMSLFKHHKIDIKSEIDNAGIKHSIDKFPFVYVYERKNMSVTLHGINIYPEFVKAGLLKKDLPEYFTERFTMFTKSDIHHNQLLEINLELQKGIEASELLELKVLGAIHKGLISKSSEFSEISQAIDTEKLIRIVLWPNGHKRYFQTGIKQKWTESD